MRRLLTDPGMWTLIAAIIALSPFFGRKLLEKQSTNRAVLAEIKRLLTVVAEHRDFWQKCVENRTTDHHALIPFSHVVYDKQVKNVGAIKGRLVAQVVQFYGYVDYLNNFQALRKDYDAAGHSDEFNKMYTSALTRFLTDFDHAFRDAFKQMRIH
jgi:hypothetical protein